MSRKNRNNREEPRTLREKHSEDVINELLGEVEDEPGIDIESNVANLGGEGEIDVRISPENEHPKRQKAFFITAIFVIIMAVIGIISSIRFIVGGIGRLADNTALKNEFARFILPVVANDIAPFENESEITNSSKISCAVWNILVNKDTSAYKSAQSGGLIIPEYDVSVSCKELFGSGASLAHQSVGMGDNRFTYDEANHIYTCPKDLRFLNYAPKITAMTENNGTYVLTVDYMPPSVTMVVEDLGLSIEADKTLQYTINRWDKKNTLMAVRFIADSDEE